MRHSLALHEDAASCWHGVFVPAGSLHRHAPALKLPFEGAIGELCCPTCSAPMQRASVRDVELDACEHGVWFDKGEFERIAGRRPPFGRKEIVDAWSGAAAVDGAGQIAIIVAEFLASGL
ncbi:MAG TPA: zf-TFIIB domain-containing protein [Candidatus Thermoplasmatota archaeon]|nr:zf-TFIIB domain-containing protein [Candidatus Thermoplasmatota archaeon]